LEVQGVVHVVRGEVDLATASAFREELEALVERGADDIVLDCAEMTFIDSSGLAELVRCLTTLRRQGRELHLIKLSEPCRRTLEITGLLPLFDPASG
jgi:anti-sigma B factor antagonist